MSVEMWVSEGLGVYLWPQRLRKEASRKYISTIRYCRVTEKISREGHLAGSASRVCDFINNSV